MLAGVAELFATCDDKVKQGTGQGRVRRVYSAVSRLTLPIRLDPIYIRALIEEYEDCHVCLPTSLA